ncbi:hypothetical protein [Aeromicrobium sp. UC242_57]|uniref:hypothetical protein n=1 Tax=Aeromicrobium sp. UC242_57 TaxID=3374624 RepID=UPI00378CFE9E
MTTQRPTWPRDRADILADYRELIGYGVTHEQAAVRAGSTVEEVDRILQAEERRKWYRSAKTREVVAG